MKIQRNLLAVITSIVIWRALTITLLLLAPIAFTLKNSFLATSVENFRKNPVLWGHANFDGEHYLNIAKSGYRNGQEAFFPFYPFLIRTLSPLFNHNYLISALFISHLSFLTAAILLFRLVELESGIKIARSTLLWLLVFPTSFYFTSAYTESIFLLLVVASFYLARTKRWWGASIIAMLATSTRFVGIFLLPALAVEFYLQLKNNIKERPHMANTIPSVIKSLPLLVIPLGLVYFMWFLFKTTGDPLAFIHSLKNFGPFRSEKIILLYQVFYRYGKMILTVNPRDPLYLTIILEALVGTIFLITSIASFKLHRLSYALFNLLAYLTPTLTGSFVSLPRYVLVCFPSFILIARYFNKNRRTAKLAFITSCLSLAYFWMKFSQAYWVG